MTEGRPTNFTTHHSASSNVEAAGSIEPSLHKELHNLAVRKLRFERVNHALQTTALVNEAYLRLALVSNPLWQDRLRFVPSPRG